MANKTGNKHSKRFIEYIPVIKHLKRSQVMKFNLLVFLPLLFSINLFAQIGFMKGDGLISINPDNFPTLNFYENITDENPVKSISIHHDEKINSFNIQNLDSIKNEWLMPLNINLDYYIFHLQCSAVKESWFQVIVNEQTNLKYWIKELPDFEYLSWENFILDVVAVRPIDSKTNPILKTANINSDKHKEQLIDCLVPVKIDGNWLKVKVEPVICDKTFEMKNDEVFEGYIRWRKDNRLLIYYFLTL